MAEIITPALRYFAIIAEQGGADPNLDAIIFAPSSVIDTGDQYNFGEGLNASPDDEALVK